MKFLLPFQPDLTTPTSRPHPAEWLLREECQYAMMLQHLNYWRARKKVCHDSAGRPKWRCCWRNPRTHSRTPKRLLPVLVLFYPSLLPPERHHSIRTMHSGYPLLPLQLQKSRPNHADNRDPFERVLQDIFAFSMSRGIIKIIGSSGKMDQKI